jgi:phage tail protein X
MLTGATAQVLPGSSPVRCVFVVKTALIAAFAALALAGCGSAGIGSAPSPTPDPSQGPGLGFDAKVTELDTAITIHAGQKLEVVLHARPGMSNWSNVRSSDTSVLTPIVNPAATAVQGVTLAAFQALAPGQAEITAITGAACSPGQACPMYAVLYSVTVTVD